MTAFSQSKGQKVPPKFACCCHAHVFGPFDQFPLAEERPYTPSEHPKEEYLSMLTKAGFDRGVLVHGSAHGWDNSAMLDTLKTEPDRLRGIAVMPPNTSLKTLETFSELGVKGMRFTQMSNMPITSHTAGRLGIGDLETLAPKLKALGWHAQLWANVGIIEEYEPLIRQLGISVVIDHLGCIDVNAGIRANAFQALAGLLSDGYIWIKLTAFRNSKTSPDYSDVKPFQDTLIEANPDQLIWGSDWPFLGMSDDKRPTVDRLLSQFYQWVPEPTLQHKILVDNPATLYGFF